MVTKHTLLALFSVAWMIPSYAAVEDKPRLSPNGQSEKNILEDKRVARLITPQNNLRAVYDPTGKTNTLGGDRLGSYAILEAADLRSLRSINIFKNEYQGLGAKDFLVGLEERTQKRILLTGNLIVKYASGTNLESIKSGLSLRLVKDFPAIQTVFFEVLDLGSLAEIESSLRQNSHVLDVRMEKLQYGKRPR